MQENKKEKKKCFVITPIGEDGSTIRRHINGIIKAAIKPALEDKYDVKAAHEITSPGSINNQVIVEIYNSDLVVANLTDLNPNVMYELAFRHALKKPIIMIMEKGTKNLPFDVNNERTIFYVNDSQGVLDLKDEIIKAENSIDIEKISNPIYDALNNFAIDQNLIKNIESRSTDEADVLKIILGKLNNLETSIRYGNNEEAATLSGIKRYRIFEGKFKLIYDKSINENDLIIILNDIKNLFLKNKGLSTRIRDINVDTKEMNISLKLRLNIEKENFIKEEEEKFMFFIDEYFKHIRGNIVYEFYIEPF